MTELGGGELLVYEDPDGKVRVDVRLEQDTVWLTQEQMARLFGRERSVITKHVRNVFKEGELPEESNVHFLHIAGSDKPVGFYSLDVIISVGYRVKSLRGTQFRIWATNTLREHLLRGFTLNEQRLAERGLGEARQAVELLARTLSTHALVTDEGQAVFDAVQRYTRSGRLLLKYDEQRLGAQPARPVVPAGRLTVEDAPPPWSRCARRSRGVARPVAGASRVAPTSHRISPPPNGATTARSCSASACATRSRASIPTSPPRRWRTPSASSRGLRMRS